MKYAELKMNTLSWQRALKFAGFYRGYDWPVDP